MNDKNQAETSAGTGRSRIHSRELPPTLSLILAFFIGLLLTIPTLIISGGQLLVAKLVWIAFIGWMSFRVFVTGRISKWRTVFFVLMAWAFVLEFKANLLGITGSAWLASEIREVPYCHIAIVSNLSNYFYSIWQALSHGNFLKWSAFYAGALLWLITSLTIGQGFCSWGCFYGGLDTTFSKILKKPLLRRFHLPRPLRDFSLALLGAMLLISLACFQPIYCLWVCPLKITTGFLDPDTVIRKIQLAIFCATGILFLIALPLVMKKRTFCTFLCPFGAWQAMVGRVNPFRVSIDADRCTLCQQCLKACPVYAIDKDGVLKHEVLSYCDRCADCFEVCPTGAIDYTVLGEKPKKISARTLYLLSAWLLGGALSLLFVPNAMLRIFHSVSSVF